MNKTVKLVNAWAEFENLHPEGELDDFCRHYLAKQRQKKIKGPLTGGVVPPVTNALLLKIIGRINKLNMSYANQALEGSGLNQVEEMGMLVTVLQEKNPRKTDIIYANLFELSSGTDMLNRLKKRGFLKEYDDLDDKRSKRVELTPEGEKAINAGRLRMMKVAQLMMNDLTEDDKKLCIQLLTNIEVKFSKLWQQHKNKAFDDVFEEVVNAVELPEQTR